MIQALETQLAIRAQPQSTVLSRRGWTRSATIASFGGSDSVERDSRDSVLDLLLRCSPRTDPRAMVLSIASVRSSRVVEADPTSSISAASDLSTRTTERSTRARHEGATLHEVTEPHTALVACRLSSRRRSSGEKSERVDPSRPRPRTAPACDGWLDPRPGKFHQQRLRCRRVAPHDLPSAQLTHGGLGVRLCSPESGKRR